MFRGNRSGGASSSIENDNAVRHHSGRRLVRCQPGSKRQASPRYRGWGLWCCGLCCVATQNPRPLGCGRGFGWASEGGDTSRHPSLTSWQTWQRPTLPRLETKYHRRWGVSRPSSEWDRVQPPRHSHQVGEEVNDFWFFPVGAFGCRRGIRRALLCAFGCRRDTRRALLCAFGCRHDTRRVHFQILSAFGEIVFCAASRRALLNESNQANRAISTGKLHALQRFHTRPINVVVFHDSRGRTCFEVGFPLRCLQRLSRPHIATLLCRWHDNRSTRGASIPVLSY